MKVRNFSAWAMATASLLSIAGATPAMADKSTCLDVGSTALGQF